MLISKRRVQIHARGREGEKAKDLQPFYLLNEQMQVYMKNVYETAVNLSQAQREVKAFVLNQVQYIYIYTGHVTGVLFNITSSCVGKM
jgi:hypothetical protein